MKKNNLLLFSFVFAAGIISFLFYNEKEISVETRSIVAKHTEKENDALEALQFLTTAAAFPNLDIPRDGYAKAYEFYKTKFSQSRLQVSFASAWKNVGPTNIGGRTLCVAINPADTSEVWIGSASGGLWKSNTGGIGQNAWTNISIGFPVLGVSSIAINPANPNEMFIGTGETYNYGSTYSGLVDRTTRGSFGMGILKSTDGGTTWTQSLNWTYQQNRGIWEIIFNPLNPSVLYAATTEGIYKSSDAGVTWTQSLNVKMAMDLAIDRIDTNIIYCGVGNLSSTGKGIYKTSNSGTSWNILTNGLPANTHLGRINITTYYNNPDILIAEINNDLNTVGFYESTNEGASWSSISPQDVATYQGWYAHGLLIKPGDPNRVLAGGVNVHSSFDGGQNFAQVSSWSSSGTDFVYADIHDIIVNPLDPDKVYIVCDGGLFRSNDFGTTFYECASGYVTTQYYIGSVSTQDSFPIMAGAQDRNSAVYYGNPNWVMVIGGDGSYNAIDPTDDNTIYGSWQYLNVMKSFDQGNNWNQVLSSSSSNSAFLAPFIICPSNPQIIYAGRTYIHKSTDGGGTWNTVGPNPLDNQNRVLTIAVSSTYPDSVCCATAASSGNNGDVFRSTNGGASFTNITNGLPTTRYLRRLTVDPTNSKIVYAAFSGFGGGHIYKSANAGNSWTDISASLPDLPFHCVAVDPLYPTIIYAGCDLTCFVSLDGGSTWSAFDTGLPEAVMIHDLVISTSDRKLVAFTHGHGVYKCDLATPTGMDEADTTFSDFTISPNPSNGIAFVNFISTHTASVEIYIYNLQGKIVKRISAETAAGRNSIRLDMEGLRSGTYLIQRKSENKINVKKIVLIK